MIKSLWKKVTFETKFGLVVFAITMVIFSLLDPLTIGETIGHFIFCALIFNAYKL